jgi:MFS family permease
MRIRNALDKVGVLRPVLEQRDFRLLWIGTTLSSIGDGFFLVALAWQVYDLEANPAALAAVGIAWTLPQVLLMVPAGVMADRVDRRRLMILGDLTRAVAVGAVAALSLSETVTGALMIALAVLLGVGEAVFTPAQVSIVPSLVPEEHLVQANSLRQFTNPLTYTLLGPFLGGMTIALVGVGWAFAVDAATFLVCAVLVAMIAIVESRPTNPPLLWRTYGRALGSSDRHAGSGSDSCQRRSRSCSPSVRGTRFCPSSSRWTCMPAPSRSAPCSRRAVAARW